MLHTQEVTGSSPVLPTKNSKLKCSQLFTRELLNAFIASRASGISEKTVKLFHFALDKLIGYPLNAQGVNDYLNSLTCGNGKHNYYRVIKTLCNWLHRSGQIDNNPIEQVSAPRRQKKLLPAISKEQLDTLLAHCQCDRDKAILNLLWSSGCRLSEVARVKASDFNWQEGTVVVLGKNNRYRKAIAGNGVVKSWLEEHDSFELNAEGIKTMLQRLGKSSGIHCNAHSFRRGFCVHNVKSGLSTRVVQALGGWETLDMVEHYSKSLTFDDALSIYQKVNGS